jgi:mannitol-1-/sugar-/sorbitol-6-phosphatase
MQQFRCTAVLFDLDGVLVDSTGSVARQWRLWAAENGLDPERIIKIAHGRRTIEVVRLLTPQLNAETEVRKIEKREADDIDGVRVMPGASDLVSTLPDSQWGVVTSGTNYLAQSRLRHADLPVPRVLVSADDVTQGKPHPEPYLKGAQLLGVAPGDCLVIEDAPAGVRSAQAAGMKAISLTSTYTAAELHEADAVVGSLAQIHVGLGGATGVMLLEVFGR